MDEPGTYSVVLRDVLEDDLPIHFEQQLDPVSNRMAAIRPRDESAFMEHWTKVLADATIDKKSIVVDGQVVGHIVGFDREGKREVGYWIARQHWGKGIASKALSRLLCQVSRRPLYGIVAKHNIASIRVLEKCGFVIENRRRGIADARRPAVDEIVLKLGATE